MKLLVGLGNPGKAYAATRHNFGFLVLDALAAKHQLSFKATASLRGELAKGQINGHQALLLKPSTFMNLSGESVQKVLSYYKVEPEKLVVVYDDIALPFGSVKLKSHGGHGGHNGLKDILRVLKSPLFDRLRLGIGAQTRLVMSDFVLQPFSTEERHELPLLVDRGVNYLEALLTAGAQEVLKSENDHKQKISPPKGQQELTNE